MKMENYVQTLRNLHSLRSAIEREPDELKPLYYYYYHKVFLCHLVKGLVFQEFSIKISIRSVGEGTPSPLEIMEEIIDWIDFTMLTNFCEGSKLNITISSTPKQ